jgi:hypothetical protein
MTECTKEAVSPAAQQAAEALAASNVFTFENLICADGWAVVTGTLGDGSTDASAPMGAPTSFVFQQEGQFWVVQDKALVCGTNPTGTTPPADATIPAALFEAGCAAG